ncbi:hypothetical protein GS908_26395 [Rhodococcus hoagii]|nr:hypothetical protein [Prescottella equi]
MLVAPLIAFSICFTEELRAPLVRGVECDAQLGDLTFEVLDLCSRRIPMRPNTDCGTMTRSQSPTAV